MQRIALHVEKGFETGLQVRPGMVIAMEREYEAGGQLAEVRSRTAVRGGWVGGRM